ncbi:hypothetical protein WJX72_002462 [[Myrmecia] bisecta]|uniref:Uncharacterized protein n=1 Tax=[Myrmecia] bisecta TaxID=41462 RepID=A0AAW1P9S5_9CHLO
MYHHKYNGPFIYFVHFKYNDQFPLRHDYKEPPRNYYPHRRPALLPSSHSVGRRYPITTVAEEDKPLNENQKFQFGELPLDLQELIIKKVLTKGSDIKPHLYPMDKALVMAFPPFWRLREIMQYTHHREAWSNRVQTRDFCHCNIYEGPKSLA